jgi:thiamine-monophosphate kinase
MSADARRMTDGLPPLEHALGDGEDFELAFAVAPEEGRRLLAAQPVPGVTLSAIGECVGAPGLWLEEGGARRPLEPRGHVHRLE